MDLWHNYVVTEKLEVIKKVLVVCLMMGVVLPYALRP